MGAGGDQTQATAPFLNPEPSPPEPPRFLRKKQPDIRMP